MPVQVGHDITETGEIDLVGVDAVADDDLDRPEHVEQMQAVGGGKVRHFAHMRLPDDAAETGKGRSLTTADPDNATALILPKDCAP